MYKKLARHGNSNAILLDKPILELLNITEHTQLKITTDGTSLIITPVQQVIPEQQHVQQADSVEPFREFIKLTQMQNIALETPDFIKGYRQNPTTENQKQVVEYVRKIQEILKDPKFSEVRKQITDAYAPSLDERIQTLTKEFKEVDLKQFPEYIQKWYLETEEAQTDEHVVERMHSQEYLDAMKQVQSVLQAKFTKLFEEYNATHKDLRRQMHENFAQARQELGRNNTQK